MLKLLMSLGTEKGPPIPKWRTVSQGSVQHHHISFLAQNLPVTPRQAFSFCAPPAGTLEPSTWRAHTRPHSGLLHLTVSSLRADVSYYFQTVPKEALSESQEGNQL